MWTLNLQPACTINTRFSPYQPDRQTLFVFWPFTRIDCCFVECIVFVFLLVSVRKLVFLVFAFRANSIENEKSSPILEFRADETDANGCGAPLIIQTKLATREQLRSVKNNHLSIKIAAIANWFGQYNAEHKSSSNNRKSGWKWARSVVENLLCVLS